MVIFYANFYQNIHQNASITCNIFLKIALKPYSIPNSKRAGKVIIFYIKVAIFENI